MYTLLLVFIFLAALILILSVLAQNPKGGGLSSAFGGSEASQFMGVKKTTDLLEKLTWGAATLIMVLSIAANVLVIPEQTVSDPASISPNINKAQEELPSFLDEDEFTLEDSIGLPPEDSDTALILDDLPLDIELEEEKE